MNTHIRPVSQPIALILVVAVAENGVIGREGGLPWRLRSDLRHFRAVTMGKPVVMGRRTFASLPVPLKGRTTIVISRDPGFAAPGIVVAPSFAAGLLAARGDALRRGTDAVAVIGGQEVFARALPLADRLEITEVLAHPEGDTYFPAIDPAAWREVARLAHEPGPDDDHAFSTVTFERVAPASV